MTDPGFVAASYAIVLGGVAIYAASVVRRLRGARRTTEMLEHERKRDVRDPGTMSGPLDGGPAARA